MDDLYRSELMEIYKDPTHKGDLADPSIILEKQNAFCGDHLHLTLNIKNKIIEDAKWKGEMCFVSIIGADFLLEEIIGKTIDEALAITNKQIIDELGGLPAVKVHCSVLADHAIKSAIYDYATRNGKQYAGLEGFDPNAEEDDHDSCETEV